MIERIMKEDERREKKVAVPPVNQYLYPAVYRVEIELHAQSLGRRKPSSAMLLAAHPTSELELAIRLPLAWLTPQRQRSMPGNTFPSPCHDRQH